jgi:hypothetical protein
MLGGGGLVLLPAAAVAALKCAVHASRPRKDVAYIIAELHKRLQASTDWLVRGGVGG